MKYSDRSKFNKARSIIIAAGKNHRVFLCSIIVCFMLGVVVLFVNDVESLSSEIVNAAIPRAYDNLNHRRSAMFTVKRDIRSSAVDNGFVVRKILLSATRKQHNDNAADNIHAIADDKIARGVPNVKVDAVNCLKIFEGDRDEILKAERFHEKYELRRDTVKAAERKLIRDADNCQTLLEKRNYITDAAAVSDAEARFPLAFSLLVYRDVLQVERLLRAIYRPHNYYCVHIDAASSRRFRSVIHSIVGCLPNVFISGESLSIRWGTFSVLAAELACARELLQRANNARPWRYFINLTGQEFPIRTNQELVQILRLYNDSNDIGGVPFDETKKTTQIRVQYFPPKPPDLPVATERLPVFEKSINMTFFKGPVHIMASRSFMKFLLNDPTVVRFTHWLNNTWIPDETLFATLNFNPALGTPGAYRGSMYDAEGKLKRIETVNRLKIWQYGFGETELWDEGETPCKGKRSRHICVLGAGDLPLVYKSTKAFINKLEMGYQPLVYDCLEEFYFNRTKRGAGLSEDQLGYYKQLDVVRVRS